MKRYIFRDDIGCIAQELENDYGYHFRVEDVQQLAREMLPYVAHTANVLRNYGVHINYAPTEEVFALEARLQSIIGEQP